MNGSDRTPESRDLISKLFSYSLDLEVNPVEPQDIITDPIYIGKKYGNIARNIGYLLQNL